MTEFYRATPRQTRAHIVDVFEAGLMPFVRSSPGMGKSSLMASVAAEFGLKLNDIRVSTSAPEDFTGLPEFYDNAQGQRRARFVPFGDMFPLEGDPLPVAPDGTKLEGWLNFYDEMNSGTKMVQAASYKAFLDRMTGFHKFHPRLAQSAAGNLATDRAIVEDLSTALQSRLIHIEMELSHDEFMFDVALKNKWDERVVAYLNFDKDALMDFKPEHQEKTFCCPRTWEFMNKLCTDRAGRPKPVKGREGLFAGTITSGYAAAFVQFCEVYKELLTIRDVLADPEGVTLPSGSERLWAIIGHLINETTDANFGDICKFVSRLPLTQQILYFRGAQIQHPKLRSHPAFAGALVRVAKYLDPSVKMPSASK